MIRRLAREPLVHFIALGALIFAGWFWLNPPQPPADEIVIDQQEFDHLKTLWKAQWKRDPSPKDVKAIIDRYVREEVFYREGLRLNLDKNDEIVKRRLAQKMEVIAGDLGSLMKPTTDEDLRRYLREHPDQFRMPQAYAFRQVLFLPAERGELASTLASLRVGKPIPDTRKDKLGVPNTWDETSAPDLANAFGDQFPQQLAKLPVGSWSGPVQSGYGLHLVLIDRKAAPRMPDFDTVKSYVKREYEYQAELKAEQDVFQNLLSNYKVRITAKDVPDEVSSSLAFN